MSDKELLQYFIDRTDERFDKIDKRLDQLIGFRWMLIGGSLAVSSIVSILVIIIFGR